MMGAPRVFGLGHRWRRPYLHKATPGGRALSADRRSCVTLRTLCPPHSPPISFTGVISTDSCPSLTHTLPSCTVNCNCMLRLAMRPSSWLCSEGTCHTVRLRARVSLLAIPFHHTSVLL